MTVGSIWPFAQISDDSCYLGMWQCGRYFVAASFKKLALITIREMWGLGLELPGLGLGLVFYDKASVSSRNLIQVSVSEVTVSTTSLLLASRVVQYEISCCSIRDCIIIRNVMLLWAFKLKHPGLLVWSPYNL